MQGESKSSKVQFRLITILFFVLAITLMISFMITYRSAKNEILDVGGEMFSKVLKDVIGFMHIMDERVKNGEITLAQAQEIVREYTNGPLKKDGTRDISKSKMSVDDYMYIWATSYRNNRGTCTMHPLKLEGVDLWDAQVQGRYVIRDSYSNMEKTGFVFREVWQNPGEPIYTFIGYQEYFSPWDWIVGCGGREEIIYKRRLGGLKKYFLLIGTIFIVITVVFTYFIHRVENERKRSENHLQDAYDALTKSEEKYRSIFENAVEGMFQTTPQGHIINANPSMAQILGYDSPQEMITEVSNIGSQLYVNPLQRDEHFQLFEHKDRVIEFECQLYRKDRSIIWAMIQSRATRDQNGKLIHIEGFFHDVTKRKEAAEALKYSHRQLEMRGEELSELARRLISAQEDERKKIAADIHDTLTQGLTGIGYKVLLCQKLVKKDQNKLQDVLKTLVTNVNENLNRSRQIISNLWPKILDDVGIVATFKKTLKNLKEETSFHINFFSPEELQVSPDQGIALFRILQESCHNIIKHAKASKVDVSLNTDDDDNLRMEIMDNGIGFDPSEKGQGLGLVTMRERVEGLGGKFSVYSALKGGCKITVTFPVRMENHDC
ncbi:MAG: cache domain-containing protein [Syntrophaceae bacterium]|nr:cache domain-containing protein [Syntrophaceae bacterium]